jgi:S-adenosylmethionine hydrolase
MAIITFTSDFGLRDHYVASVKAKIFNFNPNIQVIDISHLVEHYNIAHASFILNAVYRDFPKGTVHLVGVSRNTEVVERYLAAKVEDHYFVCADNGLISLLTEKTPMCVEILNDKNNHKPFPEKNILAFAAVSLASGKNLYDLGPQIPYASVKKYTPRKLKITNEKIEGSVIHVDHYGNAITNISKSVFEEALKKRRFEIRINVETFNQLNTYYYDSQMGRLTIFFNDLGLLEIAMVEGSAEKLLRLKYDTLIEINFFEIE